MKFDVLINPDQGDSCGLPLSLLPVGFLIWGGMKVGARGMKQSCFWQIDLTRACSLEGILCCFVTARDSSPWRLQLLSTAVFLLFPFLFALCWNFFECLARPLLLNFLKKTHCPLTYCVSPEISDTSEKIILSASFSRMQLPCTEGLWSQRGTSWNSLLNHFSLGAHISCQLACLKQLNGSA